MSKQMDEALRAASWVHPETIAAERDYWERTTAEVRAENRRLRAEIKYLRDELGPEYGGKPPANTGGE